MHPLDHYLEEGEHQHQDFKYFLSDAKKIARSLAAFANTDGGRLLVGVKDNGKVVGLKHKEEEAYVVEAAAHVFCKPAVTFRVRTWDYLGKTVLEVQVDKSNKAPHTAPDLKGRPVCYLRKADQNKVATPLEEAMLKIEHRRSPINCQMTPQRLRLVEVLKTYDAKDGYDIPRLATLSLLTQDECLNLLAQLLVARESEPER